MYISVKNIPGAGHLVVAEKISSVWTMCNLLKSEMLKKKSGVSLNNNWMMGERILYAKTWNWMHFEGGGEHWAL